jgi:HAD superfamily hydrolase (TIGR01459 family)
VTTRPPLPAMLNGLAELAELHDVFLVDQFGVLHDGRKPYPGAVEALSRLKKAGKTVVILSNSGKRARPNETRLAGLGFDPSSWDLFLSSGEAAWRRFAGLAGQPALKPGTRCLLIARDNDKSAVEGLGFELVDRDPDLVLISASEGNRVALEAYAELLASPARAGVPCFCTNPDKVMLVGAQTFFGAGQIAELYESLGGKVTWIGKPFPEIYKVALSGLRGADPSRIVAIGDSVEHDIAGAKGIGLAAALVRTGILAEMDEQALDEVFHKNGARPDYLLSGFQWQGKEPRAATG